MGKGEMALKRNLLWGMKKLSGSDGDTLRRDALKRANRAVCGRVISCSRGQERWRTELELCGCESFDDDHWSAALGTAPQRVRCRSGGRLRFVFLWSGMESGEAVWQQGTASPSLTTASSLWRTARLPSAGETLPTTISRKCPDVLPIPYDGTGLRNALCNALRELIEIQRIEPREITVLCCDPGTVQRLRQGNKICKLSAHDAEALEDTLNKRSF